MGGNSPEYEISLISGREVLANLPGKYIGIPILIPKKGNGWVNKLLRAKVDICFIAMHGPYGEDGKIQGLLETLRIKYTGSGVSASAMGMDKILFRKIMKAEGISVPGKTTKLPCFVKPHNQGSSVGASIVRNKTELARAIKLAQGYSDKVLVEEYLVGREVTCAVLGNDDPQALPVIEIVPKKGKFFDYGSKYTEGGADEIVPARISKSLTKKVQEIAVKVYQAIGCTGFARVDFLLRDNKYPVVLEINTIPGLTSMSLFPKAAKAAGISYSRLLDKIIEYAIAKV